MPRLLSIHLAAIADTAEEKTIVDKLPDFAFLSFRRESSPDTVVVRFRRITIVTPEHTVVLLASEPDLDFGSCSNVTLKRDKAWLQWQPWVGEESFSQTWNLGCTDFDGSDVGYDHISADALADTPLCIGRKGRDRINFNLLPTTPFGVCRSLPFGVHSIQAYVTYHVEGSREDNFPTDADSDDE